MPVPAPGVSGATDVTVGYCYSCALVAGGKVTCWVNWPSLDGSDPRAVWHFGGSGATDVAVGVDHTCAVSAGGRVTCWGNNSMGSSVTAPPRTPMRLCGCLGCPGRPR